ncbi:PRC-barrel domain-containing protein [Nodosilinea sp. E11]|uniref:PRC-barrel domain-containing protein n=1 Tax=Nodosilinea sp. E11 TaxID=3037479 RepID=UPI0029350967|nr:PRC-barrel domain-containing protein [Nodosilinea sp. E11]WOD40022.1 PRC-barrel domain-containing protein [Nodosilinea sp. E11]
MALHHLKDYYPSYRETVADGQMDKIDSYSVYAQGDDKVGTAKDLLVDDGGSFRYLVVDTGPWIFGKTVLLPIGLAQFDYSQTRIYVDGLSKSQVEHLPEYDDDMVVDQHYEEQVRSVYQPIAQGRSNRQFLGHNYIPSNSGYASTDSGVQTAAIPGDLRRMEPIEGHDRPAEGAYRTATHPDRPQQGATIYDQETGFYGLSEADNHGLLRSYEERLAAHHRRGQG